MPKKSKREIIRSPKGMHDILHGDIRYMEMILERAREIAEFYGFLPIKTPHLEQAGLFLRPLGETSDVVEKEMYTFRTKGGDFLALRPEGTAGIVRAYFENGMGSWPQPVKLYYEGAFFRHEKPQRGRFREFRQFGAEILGSDDAVLDALTIKIAYLILREIGFSAKDARLPDGQGPASGWKNDLLVHINSIGDKNCRPAYKKELTNYYRKKFNYLCKDCKRRLKDNPLRILDCKEKECAELKAQAPQMIERLCETCKTHFKSVLEFLDEGQIPYLLDNFLVRGFDYYGRTVFEIFLEEGKKQDGPEAAAGAAATALVGGGRYDDLASILGERPLPAVGMSLGMERIIHEMKRLEIAPAPHQEAKVFLIHIGPAAKKRSFNLMEELRAAGIKAGESISRDNLKTQLNIASKIGAKLALILGQKEAMDGSILIRDMEEGIQESVLQTKLIEKIKAKLKKK
ncbi:MAG: histidine--tRNA ligase [Candidatus Giovannonibacteria bacterium]|nr:MAG: histidine--tRNA ligase [Candidatus Giovannonibacteria bacterium]